LKLITSAAKDCLDAIDCFYNSKASHLEVANAGERVLLCLYGDPTGSDLNTSRYRIFQKRLSVAKNFVHPQDVPPTSSASKFHSYRTYLQVQQWLGSKPSSASTFQPTEWGWFLRGECLYPVMTDLPPAPQNILKVVKCGCKGACNSMRCSCRKNGMECSPACSTCKGTNCENSPKEEMDEETLLMEDGQSFIL